MSLRRFALLCGIALLVIQVHAQPQRPGTDSRSPASNVVLLLPPSQPDLLPDDNLSPRETLPEIPIGTISGTAVNVAGGVVPGATVILSAGDFADVRSVVTDSNGAFTFSHVIPGTNYAITIRAKGFATWRSPAIVLSQGQILFLSDIKLKFEVQETVTVYASTVQIATEQVRIAEQQRILGIIPNFYVVYDPDAVPLTTRLKFQIALRVSTDRVTIAGEAFLAGISQAGDFPDYRQGMQGYAQRMGAITADSFTDIMFGGAILPSLLGQDPRYFYQGTGTKKSRALHALMSPFVCKGDNGHPQPNYSSLGGDLISGAISNIYYPESNRGPGLVFQNALITTGARMANATVQEFLLRKLTPSARKRR